MKLDEIDKECFDKLVADFIVKWGSDAIKDLYALHRQLDITLHIKNFPVTFIYNQVILNKIASDYTGMTIPEMAKAAGISKRKMYYLYHIYMEQIKKKNKRKVSLSSK